MQDEPLSNQDKDTNPIAFELEKYKAVFNESLDGIIITDGETGKIIDANNACLGLFGYNKDELIGRHYLLLFDDSSAPNQNSLDDVQMFGPVLTAKNIKTKDGLVIPMDLTISTIEFGNHNFVLSTFRDARDRLKHEDKIQKYSDELHELNASKDKFFSIIAHDLKSPLSAIMGYSEILATESYDISNEDVANYSGSINRVSKELTELLDNLLNWSRIKTGKIEFDPVLIDISNLVEITVRLLTSPAKLKNIQLINNIDQELMIPVDENMMSTVLRNIVSNSIKFTENGKIIISASENSAEIKIMIQDTGIGMDQNTVDGLFLIDKNKSRMGTKNEKGTGLGLILCNEFIKKHDGAITVTSEIGKGSLFSISLPKRS